VTDHRLEGPGENGPAVPRDLPDQQAGAGEDPWEVAPGAAQRQAGGDTSEDAAEEAEAAGSASGSEEPEPDTEVPDTDEAGTGRRGAPHAGSPNPEHPVPDESSA